MTTSASHRPSFVLYVLHKGLRIPRRPVYRISEPSGPALAAIITRVAAIQRPPCSNEMSTSDGDPVRSRLYSAAAIAAAPLSPPTQSPTPPGCGGGWEASSVVRKSAKPDRAQTAAASKP